MNANDKHTTSYSAADIERYLNGELTPADMHALEKAALDDAFLADALEGIGLHRTAQTASSFDADMNQLRDRLAARTTRPRILRPTFKRSLAIAAAIIVILGLGSITWLTMIRGSRKYNLDIARQESRPQSSTPAVPDSANVAASPAAGSAAADSAPIVASSVTPRGAAARAHKPKPDIVSAKPEMEQGRPAAVVAQRGSKALTAKDSTLVSLNGAAAGVEASRLAPNQATKDPLIFTGKVLDQDMRPLSNANLTVAGDRSLTTNTDKMGNFTIAVPKKDTTVKLKVASVGYLDASFSLSRENMTGNIIQLKQQTASLNEVVVSGFGSKRKEMLRRNIDAPQKPLSLVAVPADGWPGYNSYLQSNKNAPGLDTTLAGTETISFNVNRSGGLSSFRVETSISPAHDSVSIRLIKDGPSWHLMKGRRGRAIVHITFP